MNQIKKSREKFGITQKALCEQLGWQQSRLSNYETGRRTPGLSDARAIVRALNSLGAKVDLDFVFPFSDSKSVA